MFIFLSKKKLKHPQVYPKKKKLNRYIRLSSSQKKKKKIKHPQVYPKKKKKLNRYWPLSWVNVNNLHQL